MFISRSYWQLKLRKIEVNGHKLLLLAIKTKENGGNVFKLLLLAIETQENLGNNIYKLLFLAICARKMEFSCFYCQ